ncbi:hypothetical protein P692DRAFT_20874030 [Suillus brevipes Sb2]|nr:hypothetical protein P692DRAFT_20874030 [Suillus brevipes Sb2]
MRQPEYDSDAASSDHSSRTSSFNDSASEIIRRLCLAPKLTCFAEEDFYRSIDPTSTVTMSRTDGFGGLGLGHGQGGPVDEDGNYLYSQIYPHYQRRPSQELDPPSQPKDSETLNSQSAKSPVARSPLLVVMVEGSTEEAQNAIKPSTDSSMRLESLHIVDSGKKSEVRKPGGLSRLKRSRILSNTDGSHDSGAADNELHHRQFACDTTDSQARPSSKKQRISADDHDKPAEPPVGNNAVDMANLGREIVGVLQAQTAVLASVLKVISSQ